MSNEKNGKDVSISELLKRLREQAETDAEQFGSEAEEAKQEEKKESSHVSDTAEIPAILAALGKKFAEEPESEEDSAPEEKNDAEESADALFSAVFEDGDGDDTGDAADDLRALAELIDRETDTDEILEEIAEEATAEESEDVSAAGLSAEEISEKEETDETVREGNEFDVLFSGIFDADGSETKPSVSSAEESESDILDETADEIREEDDGKPAEEEYGDAEEDPVDPAALIALLEIDEKISDEKTVEEAIAAEEPVEEPAEEPVEMSVDEIVGEIAEEIVEGVTEWQEDSPEEDVLTGSRAEGTEPEEEVSEEPSAEDGSEKVTIKVGSSSGKTLVTDGIRDLIQMINRDAEGTVPSAAETEPFAEETDLPAEDAPKKSTGTKYRFTVTRRPLPEEPEAELSVTPSDEAFEEAKQEVADYSGEKEETKEAPSFSGWSKLKGLLGFGKKKQTEEPAPAAKGSTAAEEEEPEDEASVQTAADEVVSENDSAVNLPAEEEKEQVFDPGFIAALSAIRGEKETEEADGSEETKEAPVDAEDAGDAEETESTGMERLPSFPEEDGTEAPAALFYGSNPPEEDTSSDEGIAPDPELFERIREEYPVATNGGDTVTDGEKAKEAAETEDDGEPIPQAEFDRMMQRFLTKEKYEEYERDSDLDESKRRLGQIRLEEPGEDDGRKQAEDGTGAGHEETDPVKKKGDTKEIPSSGTAGKHRSVFDSETFVPPEIDEDETVPSEEETDKDISILVAFGREEEARRKYGDDRVDSFLQSVSGKKPIRKEEEPEEEEYVPEMPEAEYDNFGQNKEIFRAFKKKYRVSLLRLTLCGLLLVVAFFLENYSLFGMTPVMALDPELFPLVYVMADLQILVFGALLEWRTILGGGKALLRRDPDPSAFVTVATVLSLVFTIYMAFSPAGKIYLYTFPLLLLYFVSILCEHFDLRRSIMTFRVISSKRTKFVIGSLTEEESKLEEEAFEDYLPDDPMLFRLGKANFVDGFFRRSREKASSKNVILLVTPFALAVAVAFFAMSVFFGDTYRSGAGVGITALLMSLPAAMFLTFSYPFYTASSKAYDSESAIVGETSLEEYCDAASISFDDTEVFPSRGVKVRSVMVFGENRIDEVINNVTSVFHVAGGPLSNVLDIITSDLHTDEDTRLLSVANDGIEADVSGTHLYLGKADYLRRNHYEPIVSDEDREIERKGEISIMYVVSGDEVVAKFYLSYKIDPDFEKILKQMYHSGICVGIRTFDPNIDDDMLSRRIRIERYPVRVLKCREIWEEPRVAERVDSGIVSKRSAKALLSAFSYCGRVQTVTRVGIVLNFISLFASAMILGVAMLFGAADRVISLYVALYQIFWTIPVFIMSKLHVK